MTSTTNFIPSSWLRFFLQTIVVCTLFVTVAGQCASERPNILFIFTDDMGYADVGCYGGNFAPTPAIDQLARDGLRFTQFYVSSPICSPSRAGLLTGMYPARWRIKTFLQSRAGNRAAGQVDFLDPRAPSLPRALKQAGYVTAHIGKWHLGGGRDVNNAPPFSAYGYDEYVSTYESPQPDPNLTSGDWIWSPDDKVKRWDRTGYFVDKTLEFLRRNRGKSCFVNFWPDDVHTPWVPEGAKTTVKDSGAHKTQEEFQRVLSEYDRQIGRLLVGLKQLGLDRNTIVIFSSDNGPGPDFRGNIRSGGMRGQKGSLYEGGIRMPFIVRWPGKTPANCVDEKTIFNAVDVFPTLCQLAGAALPKGVAFDGEDVSPALLGKTVERKKPIYWEFESPRANNPVRTDRNISPSLAIRHGKWKLLVNGDGTDRELYDLEADRKETSNVADQNPKTADQLSELVLKWKRDLP